MKSKISRTISIYWKHISRHKPLFFLMFFTVSLSAAFNSFIPVYVRKLLDIVSISDDSSRDFKGALVVLGIMVAMEFSRWLLNRITSFSEMFFITKLKAELIVSSFDYLHKHSFSFFTNNFSGSLVKKVNYFIKAIESIIDSLIWNLVPVFINIIIIMSVLFWRSRVLGFCVLLWLLVFYSLTFFFSRWKYKYDVVANEATSASTGFLADTITNSTNVKLFNGHEREVKGFFNVNEDVRKKQVVAWKMDEIFNSISSLMMIILEFGLFFVAINLWKKGVFTVGDFAMIQAYAIMLIMQGWNFGWNVKQLYRSFSDAEEMTVILDSEHGIKNHPRAVKLKTGKGEIEFRDVIFNYNETRKILDNFNLKIRAGEKVALIGPSGAGKTTIVKLLLRNFDITGGKILIDGQNISRVTMESLWQATSLVPQDPILFHRTLRENIVYGCPKASDKDLFEASKKAHCHEFISSFSSGYDTYVGERGIRLSGGERQRVAIARAILKNSPILVLDEATSSLDSESEGLIQDALDKLMKDKTVVVIAHRLSTIRKMDRIIFIDDGEIKEEGTHKELLKKKNGHYARLWNLQAGGFIQ